LLPYAPWLAVLLPFLGSALTFSVAKTNPTRSNQVAIVSIGLSTLFSLSMLPDVLAGSVLDWRLPLTPFEISVLVDPLNVIMACVVSFIGLLVTLFSVGYMRGESSLPRFWFLIQLFIGGYLVIVLSGDLLLTFIGWEVVGVCCMTLASFQYQDPSKAHAGFKTAMLLRLGDIALLASLLLIYVYAGTLNLTDLQQNSDWIVQLSQSGILLLTTGLFLVGAMGKAAQFPLQEWLPDMLAASPACFNALTECLAGPFLVARLLPVFYNGYTAGVPELSLFFHGIMWVGLVSALITALLATTQTNVFKILAFSVSSVIGYMLTALGLAGLSTELAPGYLAGTFLLTVDAFISGLLFLTAAFASYLVGSDDIRDLAGVGSGLVHRGIEVGVFAMIGIPPLSGFWCTSWIQAVALDLVGDAGEMGHRLLMSSGYLAFFLMVVTGGVTAFYGLRLMWTLFGGAEHTSLGKPVRDVPRLMRAALIAFILVTMLVDFAVPLLIPVFNRVFLPIVGSPFLETVFEVGWYVIPSMSTVVSLGVLVLGAYPAYHIYLTAKTDPEAMMAKHPWVRAAHKTLLNQLYMDAFYHSLARHAVGLARAIQESVERGLDMMNYFVADHVTALSRGAVQRLERGINGVSSLIARSVLSTAVTSYKYVELEGISRLQVLGLSEIFDVSIQRVLTLSHWLYPRIELKGFEGFNDDVKTAVTRLSNRMRAVHTGVFSYNMLAVLVAVILMMVLLLVYGGSMGVVG